MTDPTAIEVLADLVAATYTGERATVVGIAGAVASGKSTLAAELAAVLDERHRMDASVVSADGFLFPNTVLVDSGTFERKGWPETYDGAAISSFIERVRAGDPHVVAPSYSHEAYDVVAGSDPVGVVDALVLEGIVVLQSFVADELDLGVYLSVHPEDLRRWYVERFVELVAEVPADSPSILSLFRGLDDGDLREAAVGVWEALNVPNNVENVEPTRERADVVLKLDGDHRVAAVELAGRR